MTTKHKSVRALAAALITIGSLAGGAKGAVLFDGTGTSTTTHFTGDYSNGNEFTIANLLEVFGLAYIDAEGDGLLSAHTVTLWDTSDQSLVASAIVGNTNLFSISANGVSRWYEAPIATIVLTPGTYRVVGFYGDNDTSLNTLVSSSVPGVTTPIGYVRNLFPGGGITYPGIGFNTQRLTANVVISPVPEPSFALLSWLGVLTVAARRRRN